MTGPRAAVDALSLDAPFDGARVQVLVHEAHEEDLGFDRHFAVEEHGQARLASGGRVEQDAADPPHFVRELGRLARRASNACS